MRAPSKKSSPYLYPTIILVALALGVVVYGAPAYLQSWWPFHSNSAATSEDTLNSQDPTYSSDKKAPHENETKNNKNVSTSDDGSTVPVGISFAGITEESLEVRAFAAKIVEAGTCTATLQKDGYTVSGSSTALIDASTSQCNPIYIPLSDFPVKGVWSLQVTYEATGHSGISETMEITL